MNTVTKTEQRAARHRRLRAKISGTPERPRLVVHKSNTRLTAQIIDDVSGKTLAAISSGVQTGKTPRERAEAAGRILAQEAKKHTIERVVFDHGGFGYGATIKAFADAARAEGLQF